MLAPLKPAPVSRSHENSGGMRRDLEWQLSLPQKRLNVAKESRAGTGRLSASPALVARLSHTAIVSSNCVTQFPPPERLVFSPTSLSF